MRNDRRKKLPNRFVSTALLFGVSTELAISLLAAAIIATLVLGGRVSEEKMQYFAVAIQFLATFAGALIAGKTLQNRFAMTCGITAAIYCLLLIGTGILIFDCALESVWTGIVSVAAGAVAACVLCLKQPSGRRKKKVYSR